MKKHKCALLLLVLFLFIFILFKSTLIIIVRGQSMLPTYTDGSIGFVSRFNGKNTPSRNDVVVVQAEDEFWIKRVIALPGERLRIHKGIVYVNGLAVLDEFTKIRPEHIDREEVYLELSEIQLEPDQFFVIGDNRTRSVSRLVHKTNILGKVLF